MPWSLSGAVGCKRQLYWINFGPAKVLFPPLALAGAPQARIPERVHYTLPVFVLQNSGISLFPYVYTHYQLPGTRYCAFNFLGVLFVEVYFFSPLQSENKTLLHFQRSNLKFHSLNHYSVQATSKVPWLVETFES